MTSQLPLLSTSYRRRRLPTAPTFPLSPTRLSDSLKACVRRGCSLLASISVFLPKLTFNLTCLHLFPAHHFTAAVCHASTSSSSPSLGALCFTEACSLNSLWHPNLNLPPLFFSPHCSHSITSKITHRWPPPSRLRSLAIHLSPLQAESCRASLKCT